MSKLCPITRNEAVAILGISHTSLRRLEGTALHPWQDERGRWVFDEDEVRAHHPSVRRRRGKHRDPIAAAVFRKFAEGADLPDIVIELAVSPRKVRTLYEQYNLDLERGRERARNEQRRRRERAAEQRLLRQQELDQQPLVRQSETLALVDQVRAAERDATMRRSELDALRAQVASFLRTMGIPAEPANADELLREMHALINDNNAKARPGD